MRTRLLGTALLLALIALTPAPGQEPESGPGPGARLGHQFDQILREVRGRFKNLSADVQQRFARAKTEVVAMGVESRVYSRLHWDKPLAGSDLAVEVAEDGSAVLSGTVPTAEARARAVALATETVGVSRVVDHLTVAPARPAERPTEGP